MEHSLDSSRWYVQHLNFVDVFWPNRVQCIHGLFQDRKCFVEIVLALDVDLLSLHRSCVCNFFLLGNQNLLGLNLLLSLDPHFIL